MFAGRLRMMKPKVETKVETMIARVIMLDDDDDDDFYQLLFLFVV
jgi:hypothetical protein